MTKSELIERIATVQTQLSAKDVELAIKTMLDHMADALAEGDRIEIRGFGSFSLHYRAARMGRNPKTGDKVQLAGKHVPHFKPGKELRDRVITTSSHHQHHRDRTGFHHYCPVDGQLMARLRARE